MKAGAVICCDGPIAGMIYDLMKKDPQRFAPYLEQLDNMIDEAKVDENDVKMVYPNFMELLSRKEFRDLLTQDEWESLMCGHIYNRFRK